MPAELADHRRQIGFEVEVVLRGGSYWQDDLKADVRAAVLADWCDELQDWRPDQVQAALRMWRRENPDKRPNPAHIARLLVQQRGKAVVQRMRQETKPEPVADRVSPDAAKEILGKLGFGVKRIPEASS